MPPPEEEHRARGEPGTPSPSIDRLPNGWRQDTAAELETVVFATAAGDLLDHMLIGDVLPLEAIRAAQLLLDRAESLALAA
jgi:hypothetical protein